MKTRELQPCGVSQCCLRALVKMPRGGNLVDHWECTECGMMWVWEYRTWVPCQFVEAHRKLAGVERARPQNVRKHANR